MELDEQVKDGVYNEIDDGGSNATDPEALDDSKPDIETASPAQKETEMATKKTDNQNGKYKVDF